MTDTALIIEGAVAFVWRNTSAETLPEPEAGQLVEFEADTVIAGQLWNGADLSNPPPPPSVAPNEVAMHRVKKAAVLTPWPGHTDLEEAIYAAIGQLPAPKDRLAKIEFDTAPNLMREGATTLSVMAILGMTEQQRDDLLILAASLP